jgi:hypothetical protein
MYKFDTENHIHTLDGAPLIGTSSMASVLAKPLTWWAAGLAVEKFGWINKGNTKIGWTPKDKRLQSALSGKVKIAMMDNEQYLNLLDEAYSAHATKLKTSAQGGVDMHQLMEDYIKHCLLTDGEPVDIADFSHNSNGVKLQIFISWAKKNVKRFIASEINCYSKELWLGGIVDCVYEDNEGKYAVLDFKSSKEVYLSQFWQCVAYAIELEENGGYTPDGEKILTLDKPISYVAVLPFGMDKPEVQTNFDMVGGKKCVEAMVLLYKALN